MNGNIIGQGGLGEEVYSTPKIGNKKVLIVLAIVIFIIIFGFIAVLAARIWDPTWSPFRPSPESVLEKAFSTMSKIGTSHSKIGLEMEIEGPKGILSMDIKAEGDEDKTNIKEPKGSANFDIIVSSQGVKMFFTGEARAIGEASYLKIDTIPLPITASLKMMGINTEEWRGKWIGFDPKELGMSFGPSIEEAQDLEKEILELAKKYPPLQVKKEYSDKSINENKVYHYLLAMNSENAKLILMEVMEKTTGSMSMFGGTTAEEKLEIKESLDQAFDFLGELECDIYIGKKDFLVYKISGEKLIDIPEKPDVAGGKVNLSFNLEFSRFNQPVNIEAPSSSISILELISPLFQGLLFNLYDSETSRDNMYDDFYFENETTDPANSLYPESFWE